MGAEERSWGGCRWAGLGVFGVWGAGLGLLPSSEPLSGQPGGKGGKRRGLCHPLTAPAGGCLVQGSCRASSCPLPGNPKAHLKKKENNEFIFCPCSESPGKGHPKSSSSDLHGPVGHRARVLPLHGKGGVLQKCLHVPATPLLFCFSFPVISHQILLPQPPRPPLCSLPLLPLCSHFFFLGTFPSRASGQHWRHGSNACELCSLCTEPSLQGQAGHGDSRVLGGGGKFNLDLIWI